MTVTETQQRALAAYPYAEAAQDALFCTVFCCFAAALKAQQRDKSALGRCMGRACVDTLRLAQLNSADMLAELRQKTARNRRRKYVEVDGVWLKSEDGTVDTSDLLTYDTLREFQAEAYHNKLVHDFNVTDINLEFCLLYSELAEAREALDQEPEHLGEELADVMIYLLGISEILGVDLQRETEALLGG